MMFEVAFWLMLEHNELVSSIDICINHLSLTINSQLYEKANKKGFMFVNYKKTCSNDINVYFTNMAGTLSKSYAILNVSAFILYALQNNSKIFPLRRFLF